MEMAQMAHANYSNLNCSIFFHLKNLQNPALCQKETLLDEIIILMLDKFLK